MANYVPTKFDGYLRSVVYRAEQLHREIAASDESLDKWAKDHLLRRVIFLARYIKPLVEKDLINFDSAIKAEDLVLVTRFLDLLHFSDDNLMEKQRAIKSGVKRYLAKRSDDELRSFTLRQLIECCVLNLDINDPKANPRWMQIRGDYKDSRIG